MNSRPKRHYYPIADGKGTSPPGTIIEPKIKDPLGINVIANNRLLTFGKRIEIDEHPYIVNIFHSSDSKSECGRCVGTVITPYNILTMATCFPEAIEFHSGTEEINIDDEISKHYYVRLSSKWCHKGGTIIGVERINISPDTQDLMTGLAILLLKSPTQVRIVTLFPTRFEKEYYVGKYRWYNPDLNTFQACQLAGWPTMSRRRAPGCYKSYMHRKGPEKIGIHKDLFESTMLIDKWKVCSRYNDSLDDKPNVLCGLLYKEYKEPCPFADGTPMICGGVQFAMLFSHYGCTEVDEPITLLISYIRLAYVKEEINITYIWVKYRPSKERAIYSAPLLIITAVILSRCLI